MFFVLISGCSNDHMDKIDDPRVIPDVNVPGVIVPSLSESGIPIPGASALPLNTSFTIPVPVPQEPPTISLVNMDGAVLTMWSRSAGSSLWGYYIDDSNNFGDLRNWNIREGTRPGTIQFENKEIGTCMTSFNGFKGGVQLSTAPRAFSPERFDFKLHSTINGNYILQSMSTNLCVRSKFFERNESSSYATTIVMQKCPSEGEIAEEFMWSIGAPLSPALLVSE